MLEVKTVRTVGQGWVTLEMTDGLMRVARDGSVGRVSNVNAIGAFVKCREVGDKYMFTPPPLAGIRTAWAFPFVKIGARLFVGQENIG